MTDLPISVQGITALSSSPMPNGIVMLATANFTLGPLLFVGAVLAIAPGRTLQIWLPKNGRDRRASFTCKETRRRVIDAIAEKYTAITGRDPLTTPLAKASTFKDTFDEHPQTA